MLSPFEVTGRVRSHVVQTLEPRFAAQPAVVQAFMAMRDAAAKDGIDLMPFSSFRDFDTQLRIWNLKFTGKKPLYDLEGNVRDFDAMTPQEVVHCILNWSAFPGGSRHQWGTEIDAVDANAMPPGYAPKLLPEEVAPGGLFRKLHQWLDAHMREFDFFRPYNYFKGGMYPEPWHLSYAPQSLKAIQSLSVELLIEVTQEEEFLARRLPWKCYRPFFKTTF